MLLLMEQPLTNAAAWTENAEQKEAGSATPKAHLGREGNLDS